MTSKGRLAEQSEATRALLVEAARALFAEQGYAATSTEDVVRRARVTRGALYHHFGGKDELFRLVYETLEAELARRSAEAAVTGRSPLEMLKLGIAAYLDACLDPGVQQIVLLDGLSVLGWDVWHGIGLTQNWGLLRAGVDAAIAAGEIASRSPDELTHLIQGALIQAGMVVARAADPPAARDAMRAEVERLLDGLRVPSGTGTRKRRPR